MIIQKIQVPDSKLLGDICLAAILGFDQDIKDRQRWENEGGFVLPPAQPSLRPVAEMTHREWMRLYQGRFE
jgi:hypothetical protein